MKGSRNNRYRRGEKGFTLIELIVVMAIMGIVALILTPNLVAAIDKARYKASILSGMQLKTAMNRYLIDHEEFPLEFVGATAEEQYASLIAALGPYANFQSDPQEANWDFISYTPVKTGPAQKVTGYTLVIGAHTNNGHEIRVSVEKVDPDPYE